VHWAKSEFAYVSEVIKSIEFGGQATMNAKELLVHNSCEGKAAEGFHAGIVYPFRVLVLAFEFESEVIG
jgi:hypothetical protein